MYQRFKQSSTNIIIAADIKSFARAGVYQVGKQAFNDETLKQTSRASRRKLSAIIAFRQDDDLQVMLITSISTPDWVAVLPMSYIRDHLTHSENHRHIYLGSAAISMAQCNPFPPILSPFVMPKTKPMLTLASANIVANANDPQVKLFNPFSGLEYSAQTRLQAKPLNSLFKAEDIETNQRAKIWDAFNRIASEQGAANQTPEFRMRCPVLCPYTADIRLDHHLGVSVFLELKNGHATLEQLASGKLRFKHRQRALDRGKGIFTFTAPWDYLLTMVNPTTGYLIPKDSIPVNFWHSDPGDQWNVTHEFEPHDLNKYRILLEGTPEVIVRQFRRIICGTGAVFEGLPKASTMSAADIIRVAGPCPPALLKKLKYSAPGAEAEGADEDDWTVKGLQFTTAETDTRYKVRGGKSMVQDERLFEVLMNQCRRKGQGCVLDLGKWHQFGRMAMVKHTWTNAEKTNFDASGRPPCWPGMLPSDAQMVSFITLTARFREGYAPQESTPNDVKVYLAASPCLLIITSFHEEMSHATVQRWVVPSEFMPKFHVGAIKRGLARSLRTELFLENKMSIARLTTADDNLHATIHFFLGGGPTTVGISDVPVADTQPYLKTIGEYKKLGELHFDKLLSNEQRTSAGRAEEAAADEDVEEAGE